jgi:prevent-host-death family protein
MAPGVVLPSREEIVKNVVMVKTNVADAKARLSEYLDRAQRGERVIICRHNQPVAELRAVDEIRAEPRPIGPLAGRQVFDVPPAFFDPLPDLELDLWEGAPVPGSPARRGRVARAPRAGRGKTRSIDQNKSAPKRGRS